MVQSPERSRRVVARKRVAHRAKRKTKLTLLTTSLEMRNDIDVIAKREHRSVNNVVRALVLLGLRVYLNLSADVDEEAGTAQLSDHIRNAGREP